MVGKVTCILSDERGHGCLLSHMPGGNVFVPLLEKITNNSEINKNDGFDSDSGNSEAAVGCGCSKCSFASRFNECKEKDSRKKIQSSS